MSAPREVPGGGAPPPETATSDGRGGRLVTSSPDWQDLAVTREVGRGAHAFARARAALLGWDVHRTAGLRISVSTPPAAPGVVVDQVLGLGRLGATARCRVSEVVDSPRRAGFAYVALVPHPEEGQERFVLTHGDEHGDQHGDDDVVRFTITSRARLVSTMARAVPAASRALQDVMVRRYLAAAARLAR